MNSAHDPDPKYLSPTDAQIIEFVEEDETLSFGIALSRVRSGAGSLGPGRVDRGDRSGGTLDDVEERYD